MPSAYCDVIAAQLSAVLMLLSAHKGFPRVNLVCKPGFIEGTSWTIQATPENPLVASSLF